MPMQTNPVNYTLSFSGTHVAFAGSGRSAAVGRPVLLDS